jgi:uncharacterized phage protein gp47/JayE
MAFNRPTIQTILLRLQSALNSRLDGTDSFVLRSLLYVIARVVAAVVHGLYGHLDYIARQITPDSADAENLSRHAFWLGRGMTLNAATAATGPIDVVGTDGSVIVAGSTLQRSDGVEYTTTAEVVFSGGTATAAVTATTTGQVTNATVGQTLTFVSPIAGVQSRATVAAGGLTGGTDVETPEELLVRLREAVQQPPQGGSDADYIRWAKEVSGVTRVWVFRQWDGPGTVGVYFVRDNDASLIPDAAEVQAVADHIDPLRPSGAKAVNIYPPIEAPVDLTIKLQPNTESVRLAAQAELETVFTSTAVEDGYGSGTVPLSHITAAISSADGETDHLLVTPVSTITPNAGEIATLGTITWQTL